jgi:hypothetical protein
VRCVYELIIEWVSVCVCGRVPDSLPWSAQAPGAWVHGVRPGVIDPNGCPLRTSSRVASIRPSLGNIRAPYSRRLIVWWDVKWRGRADVYSDPCCPDASTEKGDRFHLSGRLTIPASGNVNRPW